MRESDTLSVHPGYDHAQSAAPGYAMYYSWAIRHLPGQKYSVPEFSEAHRWTMEADAKV